jgi:hypothetical protein
MIALGATLCLWPGQLLRPKSHRQYILGLLLSFNAAGDAAAVPPTPSNHINHVVH